MSGTAWAPDLPLFAGLPAPAAKRGAPATSGAAADAMRPRAVTLRAHCWDVLAATPEGLTADAVAARLGESVLAIRPRLSELHRAGLVVDSGRRGRNASGRPAVIWIVREGP